MDCLCNIFDNEVIWLIIIALLLLSLVCGSDSYPLSNGGGSCGCGCH
jgi:hypothetical protein